ncbi:MAG: ParB/RepB/Spo0J family partition protein [Candidatus Bipolaricaulota bacterium]
MGFRRRLSRGLFHRIRGRRRPRALLPFQWVTRRVRILAWRQLGIQEVDVDKIVGSVNRYRDFDRAFLPRHADRDRLHQLDSALERWEELPPVSLYKVGDAYFVEDGHHRLAAARKRGARVVDAEVVEFVPDVPLSADVTPEAMVRKAEYSAFLKQTRLNELRPDQCIEFSELGKYRILLEHIDVHRYFLGLEQGREIPYEEAVVSWYDRVYMPLVETLRRARVLQSFPGRTEADLYVWISEHLYYLRQREGPDVDAERAVQEFARNFGISGLAKLFESLLETLWGPH